MKNIIKILPVLALVFAVSCSGSKSSSTQKSDDQYQMDVSSSEVRLTTVKNGDIEVKGFLNFKSGHLDFTKSPQLKLEVDMTTWNSGLKLRDDRVQNTFFDVATKANQTATLVIEMVDQAKHIQDAIKAKEMYMGSISGKVKYYGQTLNIRPLFKIQTSADGVVTASTTKPFEIKISDLKMNDNLKKLMVLCAHESIDDIVKINVVATFKK